MSNIEQEKLLINLKISSNVIASQSDSGLVQINYDNLVQIGQEVAEFREAGHDVTLGSSGAIAVAMEKLGITELESPRTKKGIRQRQRLSTIGQPLLHQHWMNVLPEFNVGQALFTQNEIHIDDLETDPLVLVKERKEAIEVAKESLGEGDILVINENDAISSKDIKFGDNDILMALWTVLGKEYKISKKRSVLVMLGVKDGILERKEGKDIVIPEITLAQCKSRKFKRSIDNGEKSVYGTGGIASKLEAGKMVTSRGIDMFVANGSVENAAHRVLKREIGTHFIASR